MKKHIYLLLLAIVIAIIALIPPIRIAYACTCAPVGTAKEELAISDYVFQGRVTSVIPIGISVYSVSFDVIRVWKGIRYKSVTLKEVYCPLYQTPSSMMIGREYIIYARGEPTNPIFGLCSRIISQDINDEIKELGTGTYPMIENPTPIYLRQEYVMYLCILILLVPVVIAIIYVYVTLIKRKNISNNKA